MLRRRPSASSLALLAICLGVVVIYGSLIKAPALIWDDEPHIFANPIFRDGPWWKLWTSTYFGLYIPITYSAWDVLFHLADGAVWPFRILNVALHLANVLLFRRLLLGLFRRLNVDDAGAVIVGVAVFALHPLQSATVSWISAGRDLFATFFAFCAVAVYFGDKPGRYFTATTLYAAALLCKPSVASLPLAILVFVWFFERNNLRAAAPAMGLWLALAAASALVTMPVQSGTPDVVLIQRPIVALDALGFYALKFVAPLGLTADYGRTPPKVLASMALLAPTILAAVASAAALTFAARRDRAFAIAALWPVLLLPVLGLIPFAYQSISTVADHYNYLPLAVLAGVTAVALARVRARIVVANASAVRWFLLALALVVAGNSLLSWRRTRDWIGNERFFADMLAKNPASISARINLSTTRCESGDWFNGLPVVRTAFEADSTSGKILANVALCSFAADRLDDVVQLQRRFADEGVRADLAKDPTAAAILANIIAGAYVRKNEPFKAFVYLCQATALAPADAEIQRNMSDVSTQLADRGERVRCPGLLPWDVVMRGVAAQ